MPSYQAVISTTHQLNFPALSQGKKAFFLSDLHLGYFSRSIEQKREEQWVNWLRAQEREMRLLFLVGDIFDTWFEYRQVVPRGFVRLQGYLADLSAQGVGVHYLVGNHDLLVGDYMRSELGIEVYRKPLSLSIGDTRIYLAHGDGLGRGDLYYKLLKSILTSSVFKFFFGITHPDVGLWVFDSVSRSRIYHRGLLKYRKKSAHERLLEYVQEIERHTEDFYHHYVLAHTHLAHQEQLPRGAMYTNLGDGVYEPSHATLDAESQLVLHRAEALDLEK